MRFILECFQTINDADGQFLLRENIYIYISHTRIEKPGTNFLYLFAIKVTLFRPSPTFIKYLMTTLSQLSDMMDASLSQSGFYGLIHAGHNKRNRTEI